MIHTESGPPITVGIYDHALFMAGGGQRYACALASLLQTACRVTFITHRTVSIRQLESWYGLDLTRCDVKNIPLPYYAKKPHGLVDEIFLPWFGPNPFKVISEESRNYDLFINANMLTKITPQSKASIFICHFPDHKKSRYFAADRYTALVTSSQYGAHWIREKWGLPDARPIYPAVEAACAPLIKEPLILSVARFEHTGSKNQLEMINTFEALCRQYPAEMKSWSLTIAGGTFDGNPYFAKVLARAGDNPKIRVMANLSNEEIKNMYARASLFWHACGLNTDAPSRAEHFGMTTVEAMQNRCVPVVINKGGQREIVEHGKSGYLFDDTGEWMRYSLNLIRDIESRKVMAQHAEARGGFFKKNTFEDGWKEILLPLLKEKTDDQQGLLAASRSVS